jgi:hypothetical protein
LAESRDLSVETYSDESVTVCGWRTSTFTGIAGGGPAGPAAFLLQATPAASNEKTAARRSARSIKYNRFLCIKLKMFHSYVKKQQFLSIIQFNCRSPASPPV